MIKKIKVDDIVTVGIFTVLVIRTYKNRYTNQFAGFDGYIFFDKFHVL